MACGSCQQAQSAICRRQEQKSTAHPPVTAYSKFHKHPVSIISATHFNLTCYCYLCTRIHTKKSRLVSSLEKCCEVQQPSIECCIKQRKQLMIRQAEATKQYQAMTTFASCTKYLSSAVSVLKPHPPPHCLACHSLRASGC